MRPQESHRWPAAWVIISVIALGAMMYCQGCKTTADGDTVPDWQAWSHELDLIEQDLADGAKAFPEQSDRFDELAAIVGQLDRIVETLEAGGDPGDVLGWISAAVVVADEMLGDENDDIRAAAFVLKAIIRRLEAHVEQ